MMERCTMLVRIRRSSQTSRELHAEEVAMRAGVHPDFIDRLFRLGLIEPAKRTADHLPLFDASVVPLIRKILRLRRDLGINYVGIGVVLDLMARIEALEARIRELEQRLWKEYES